MHGLGIKQVAKLALTLGMATMLMGAGDLTRQTPIEVKVELGNASNEMVFTPSALTFETGKLYKLTLTNPSPSKHYFTSYGLASKVFTRKVQIKAGSGSVAEVKGIISEIEVFPGHTVEWWFVPVQTGSLSDLHCHVKDDDGQTHAKKGMVGTIEIK